MPGVGQSGIAYPGIALKDLPLQWEQMRNFGGGEDSYDDPIDLAPNVSQRMINIIVRDRLKARTRPGADPLGGAGPGGAHAGQGLYWFLNANGGQLLAAVNGKLYSWNGAAWGAALAGWSMASTTNTLAAAMGMDKMLLSDGVGPLQVWDGTGAGFVSCGSDPVTSPPVGSKYIMWDGGRMWVWGAAAVPNDQLNISNFLAYGATQWNATTQSLRIGAGSGDPIATVVRAWNWTYVVLKQNSVWIVYSAPNGYPSSPGTWSANQDPQSLTDGIGCVGPYAAVAVANDVMFLSQDGVRTVQRMQAAEAQFQVNAPISRPIQFWIDQINWAYASTTCAVKYLEFVMFAVPLGVATSPNTVLCYNWRLGVWCGVFQGWTPAMFACPRFGGYQTMTFVDSAGLVNQWKDQAATNLDSTYEDNGNGYSSQLNTRSFTFGDLESPKAGWSARLRFNQGNAALSVTAEGDDAELNSFSAGIAPAGSPLGVGELGTFLLASQAPSLVPLSLRGLPAFNELYLSISSQRGWWELRNLSVGARLRPLKVK